MLIIGCSTVHNHAIQKTLLDKQNEIFIWTKSRVLGILKNNNNTGVPTGIHWASLVTHW